MRALQTLIAHGSCTGVIVPRVMFHKLQWVPGQRVAVRRDDRGALLIRFPTDEDIEAFTHSTIGPQTKLVMQKVFLHGNAKGLVIPRDLLITLGWIRGQKVIVELLEDRTLCIRPPEDADVRLLISPTRLVEHPGAVRS